MRRFRELLLMNFRKVSLPIIITSLATLIVQILIYSVMSFSRDIRINEELCKEPVSFNGNSNIWFWISIVSITVMIMIINNKSCETEKNILFQSVLPVNGAIMWAARFVQAFLALLCILCVNYGAVCINYILYILAVKDKFRDIFLFEGQNNLLTIFLSELVIICIISLIISWNKVTGRGGNTNEQK